MRPLVRFLLVISLGCIGCESWAIIELPRVIGDNMVLQRGVPVPIWGTEEPYTSITVSFAGQSRKTLVGADGKWLVVLSPLEASSTPAEMLIDGLLTSKTISNVLVGEVWICAGQSNMEWKLSQDMSAAETLDGSFNQAVRLLNITGVARGGGGNYSAEIVQQLTFEKFVNGSWKESNRESAAPFSAVGYYFAQHIQNELGVPVGIINTSIGGTPIEAWISREALDADEELSKISTGNWLDNPLIPDWCRTRARSNLKRAFEEDDTIPGDDIGPNHSFKPTFMWDAGIKPLIPFAIRGALWYQGESNADTIENIKLHENLFRTLITDWRTQWGQGFFPFIYAQLPGMGRPNWPLFRESQRRMLYELPNLGMATTIDLGHPTNVHPTNKSDVGYRMALWALGNTYGQDIVYSGPDPTSFIGLDKIVLTYKKSTAIGLNTIDGLAPVGFEIAGRDLKFFPADAEIVGQTVELKSDKVSDPEYLRYAWEPYPVKKLNLVNFAGLPAVPFTWDSRYLHRASN